MEQTALFEKLMAGRISHLDYLLQGCDSANYRTWCDEHGVEPDDDNAEVYFDLAGTVPEEQYQKEIVYFV